MEIFFTWQMPLTTNGGRWILFLVVFTIVLHSNWNLPAKVVGFMWVSKWNFFHIFAFLIRIFILLPLVKVSANNFRCSRYVFTRKDFSNLFSVIFFLWKLIFFYQLFRRENYYLMAKKRVLVLFRPKQGKEDFRCQGISFSWFKQEKWKAEKS